MVTATEAGKQKMNGKPMTGVQRKPEYVVNPDGFWYYSNKFMARAYACLTQFGDMTFEQFKVKGKVPECWPSAFNDVRSDLMLAGKLKTKQEIAEDNRLRAQGPPATSTIKLSAPLANPGLATPEDVSKSAESSTIVLGHGVRNGTTMGAAIENAKVSSADDGLKRRAEKILEESPDISYDDLKVLADWPEMNMATFMAIRANVEKIELSGRGNGRMTEETRRIRANLLKITSLSLIKALDVNGYQRQNGHYLKVPTAFYGQRKRRIKELEESDTKPTIDIPNQPAVAQVAGPAQVPDSEKQKGVKILLTLPIEDVDPPFRKILKQKIDLVFKEMTKGSADAISIVTLDDPAALEVRKTIYY